MKGKITDIETMGSADGPGVRLVLFMSGCKLRCVYCHNPETWNMKNYKRKISSRQVLKLFNKYKGYYGESGGVTFSGGEPLLQSKFVLKTIKLLKKNNIHVALDTSGVADNYLEILELVEPEYVTHEISAKTKEEKLEKVLVQMKALGRI